jgi:plasmid stability protein
MGQILVRNLDDAVIQRLKRRASREKLSLEETVRRILDEAAKPKKPSKAELLAEMRRIREMGKPITKPPYAQHLIREDRDGGPDGRYRR